MKSKFAIIFLHVTVFLFLTIFTQIGGLVHILSIWISKRLRINFKFRNLLVFVVLYLIFLFALNPLLAKCWNREQVVSTKRIKPASFLTIILNRNYVRPEMNRLLIHAERYLADRKSSIQIRYLDANFPMFNGFPLLPHLSHNDGKKLDLSLVYKTRDGIILNEKKSVSGYGIFEDPAKGEFDQTDFCKKKGYFQYDYPKYLTLGAINDEIVFSEKGTLLLLQAILASDKLEKIFLEPHLRDRLGLHDSRIRFQGCRAVRHDDHIHIQVK